MKRVTREKHNINANNQWRKIGLKISAWECKLEKDVLF
jgi:hypothetical protein